MPRTSATITQADVARTIRAARQAGASEVEIRPDGTMIVHLSERRALASVYDSPSVEPEREIVL